MTETNEVSESEAKVLREIRSIVEEFVTPEFKRDMTVRFKQIKNKKTVCGQLFCSMVEKEDADRVANITYVGVSNIFSLRLVFGQLCLQLGEHLEGHPDSVVLREILFVLSLAWPNEMNMVLANAIDRTKYDDQTVEAR